MEDKMVFKVAPVDILTIEQDIEEIIRIEGDGRIFWRKREVETDDDFRAAMLDFAERFRATP